MKNHVLTGLVACLGLGIGLVAAESPATASGPNLNGSAFYSGDPGGVNYTGCYYGPMGTTVHLYWSTVSQSDCK
jgi:hypothetical protein